MPRPSQYPLIEELYIQGDTTLVFPSEVVAAGWRRALTDSKSRRAVRSDRILSWDVFKEITVPIHDRRQPVSRMIRSAFAELLIEQNAEQPFFERLIERSFAGDRPNIAEALIRLFPRLPVLLQSSDRLDPKTVADYHVLFKRYQELLDTYELFEPGWDIHRRFQIDRIKGKPILLWPELLEDYAEYRQTMEGIVETIPIPVRRIETAAPFREYRTSRDELSALFDAIESDIDSGIPTDEISVTVTDLETLKPWIEEAAARRGIAIKYGAGTGIGDQPGGRIFTRIDEVFRGGWNARDLASLLYERSLPWRNPRANDRLARFGYRAHCYTLRDWRDAFSIAADLPPDDQPKQLERLREQFGRLHNDLSAVAAADTPSKLRTALRIFLTHHVARPDDTIWNEASYDRSQRVYETAQREVAAMCALEEKGIPIASPWRFFLGSIAERRYVPKQSSGAVAFYPYRVAAGLPVTRHYVVGLSQSGTRVRLQPPLGLRTDDFQLIAGSENDRSATFFDAYAWSMGNTSCSCAVETPGGVHVRAPESVDLPVREDHPGGRLWEREREWWSSQAIDAPRSMYPSQINGLERALETTLSPVDDNFQRDHIPPDVLAILKDVASVSPTSIDRYHACPYAFFVSTLLGIKRKTWGFQPTNRLMLGLVAHSVLARLVKEKATTYPDADDRIDAIISEAFQDPEARLYLPRVAGAQHRNYLTAVIDRLRAEESVRFDCSGPVEWEVSVTGTDYDLTGKIDRVVDDTDSVGILDYKLTVGPKFTAGKILPDDGVSLSESSTIQLPCYVYLYENQTQNAGVEVDRVAYVDLTEGSVKVIADRTGGKRYAEAWHRLRTIVATLPGYLSEMQRSIASGDLRCQPETDCAACGIRGICRSCFVTRRYSGEL